jgi:hypothetical protein
MEGAISDENLKEVNLAKRAGLIPEDMAGSYSDPVTWTICARWL